jgi:hypothetical protein
MWGLLEELSDEEILALGKMQIRWLKILKKALNPHGFNLGMNIGSVAGAGLVDHLHYHIVPRWHGDTNFMPILADTKVLAQSLDACYDKLLNTLREFDNAEPKIIFGTLVETGCLGNNISNVNLVRYPVFIELLLVFTLAGIISYLLYPSFKKSLNLEIPLFPQNFFPARSDCFYIYPADLNNNCEHRFCRSLHKRSSHPVSQ